MHGCLVPDWGLSRFLNGDLGAEGVLNVALFVPVAFFAVLIWQTPILTVIVAAMGSMVIELLQPMLGRRERSHRPCGQRRGAMIGATAAAVLLLIADSVRARRWFAARTVGVIVAVVIVAAMVSGIGRLQALHPRAQDDLVPVATPGILRC